MAGNVKLNNLGVGAEHPGEVTPEDDIYEQYKKRMMLGYRYRPNPLVISPLLTLFVISIEEFVHPFIVIIMASVHLSNVKIFSSTSYSNLSIKIHSFLRAYLFA